MSQDIPIIVRENNETKELTIPGQPLNVLVHQQGIRVDVPNALQIDGRRTLKTVEDLTERDWQHASTSQIFEHLFRKTFPLDDETLGKIQIPKTVEELKEGDFGVQHVCGMIIMIVETMFRAKDAGVPNVKIFIREIETHLHPRTQQRIMSMINEILVMFGSKGGVTTEEPE